MRNDREETIPSLVLEENNKQHDHHTICYHKANAAVSALSARVAGGGSINNPLSLGTISTSLLTIYGTFFACPRLCLPNFIS